MSKTAPIPDDAHTLIIDKQRELKEKHKITVKISDLIAMYIKDSVKRTEELLGLKSEKKLDSTKPDITGSVRLEVVNNMKPDLTGNAKSDIIGNIVQGDANNQEVKTKDNGHASSIAEDGIGAKT